MLSLLGRGATLCDGVTRRELVRVGALAFGGLTLADLLRKRSKLMRLFELQLAS